jgi:hypothetical protein
VIFYLPNPTKYHSTITILGFLGKAGDRNAPHDLVDTRSWYKGHLPDELLPIAGCVNDRNFVTLKICGPDSAFGGVWYWDSDMYCTPELGECTFWLADSFNEFLSMLVYDFEDFEDENEFNEAETLRLFQAIQRGNVHTIERYLNERGDPECRNDLGMTPLMAAVKYSWPKMVRMLLEHGANPNACDSQGRTALHYAAKRSFDCCKILLRSGADVNARDHAGKSILGEWWYELDQFLRAHGAKD